MAFLVRYTIDDVGYAKTVDVASVAIAKTECEMEIKTAYPTSTYAVTSVEEVDEPKKSKAKKEKKDADEKNIEVD